MLEQRKRQPIWKTIRKGVTKMNGGKKSLSLLTAIQIIFFGVVLVAAFVIKLLGGSIYETVQSWYTGELNDSVLADHTPESVVSSELSTALVSKPPRNTPETPKSSQDGTDENISQLGDASGV